MTENMTWKEAIEFYEFVITGFGMTFDIKSELKFEKQIIDGLEKTVLVRITVGGMKIFVGVVGDSQKDVRRMKFDLKEDKVVVTKDPGNPDYEFHVALFPDKPYEKIVGSYVSKA